MEAFKEHGVVSDVLDSEPKHILKLGYGSTDVKPGLVTTPTDVQKQPTVEYPAEANCYYTLVMTDPDAPSRANPKNGEWHHWMVVNIPGCDVLKGEVKSAYIGSGPPEGTGLHRYVFAVYRQDGGKQDFSALPTLKRAPEERARKKIRDFLLPKYKMTELVAANFFLAEFDDAVPALHKELSGK